jgi:hypothetical protein
MKKRTRIGEAPAIACKQCGAKAEDVEVETVPAVKRPGKLWQSVSCHVCGNREGKLITEVKQAC